MTRSIEIDTTTVTREAWLHAAINVFRPRFAELEYPLPEKIHVSVGFAKGARGENATILGQTWAKCASADGVNHVFVSPAHTDTDEVLVTLLHELIHVVLDCEDGHTGRFAEIATLLGFKAPMTLTPAGPALRAEMLIMVEELGPYPHGVLNVNIAEKVPVGPDGAPVIKIHTGPKAQTTRYRKVQCPKDGYTVRVTSKWLDVGFPTCPCGTSMVLNEK